MGLMSFLAACGGGSLQSRLNREVERGENVSSSGLSIGQGGGFERMMAGSVQLDVDQAHLEAAFDDAWRAAVTYLHTEDEHARNREVQGVTGVGRDGSSISPTTWIEVPDSQITTVGMYFERYGLA